MSVKINKKGLEFIQMLAQKMLEDLGKDMFDRTVDKCPVKTGALKASLELKIQDKRVEITTDKDYGFYVEFKKPYIRPSFDEIVRSI